MLLDLYAACYERRQVSVSSLCIAAAVPATTALRWIKNMTDAGLLDRSCDPNDARRIFIGISEKARFAMDRYFDKRSEEHTSELQSLMRLSYAVFCLKKKNKTTYLI